MKHATQIDPTINIYLKQLDTVTTNLLKYFFTAKLSSKVHLSRFEDDANLLILDDGKCIDADFADKLTEENKFSIILHMKPESEIKHERLFWVKKPIAVNQLLETINEINQLLINPNVDKTQGAAARANLPTKETSKQEIQKQNHKLSIITNHQTESDLNQNLKDHKYVASFPTLTTPIAFMAE